MAASVAAATGHCAASCTQYDHAAAKGGCVKTRLCLVSGDIRPIDKGVANDRHFARSLALPALSACNLAVMRRCPALAVFELGEPRKTALIEFLDQENSGRRWAILSGRRNIHCIWLGKPTVVASSNYFASRAIGSACTSDSDRLAQTYSQRRFAINMQLLAFSDNAATRALPFSGWHPYAEVRPWCQKEVKSTGLHLRLSPNSALRATGCILRPHNAQLPHY